MDAEDEKHSADLALRQQWFDEAKKQTEATLPEFVAKVLSHQHDYNTCVWGTAAIATAAAWAADDKLGLTGFQAGGVMWEFMQEWNGVKAPARLLTGDDLLYPQYAYKFRTIPADWLEWAKSEAEKRLAEKSGAHPSVRQHWRDLSRGKLPDGVSVAA